MTDVLIAEDELDTARVLVEAIGERLRVATRVVPNGALVTEAIASGRPSLLVLDVSLPGLSGLDVFDLVRSDPSYAGIPVLFLTGSPEKAATASSAVGVHRIMAKPFDVDRLVATVHEMLAAPVEATKNAKSEETAA